MISIHEEMSVLIVKDMNLSGSAQHTVSASKTVRHISGEIKLLLYEHQHLSTLSLHRFLSLGDDLAVQVAVTLCHLVIVFLGLWPLNTLLMCFLQLVLTQLMNKSTRLGVWAGLIGK